jgi:hypothetical protein
LIQINAAPLSKVILRYASGMGPGMSQIDAYRARVSRWAMSMIDRPMRLPVIPQGRPRNERGGVFHYVMPHPYFTLARITRPSGVSKLFCIRVSVFA